MKSKIIGGVLLIVGTSIGGGMLALPVANAATGFWPSCGFLVLCWAIMTLGALFILEANLYLPSGKNMISMAQATLGVPGLALAWFSYIFLLYTLLAAYISGGADVFGSIFMKMDLPINQWQSSVLFTLFFGSIVYGGIRSVDLVNRGLMFGKLGIYLLLILLIAPWININNFNGGDYRHIDSTIMILVTSFGFAIIIPNLRDYFNDNVPLLKKVIVVGSLIPLFCYLAWDAVIMGSLPSEGNNGLAALINNEHTTSALASILSKTINSSLISYFFNLFTSICMLTAFLGVSLCLISFLADGLRVEQQGKAGLGLFILTFMPPLLVVIYFPGAYIHALNYAGIFCVLLLLLLPALMILKGRTRFKSSYRAPGGKVTPILIVIISIILILTVF